MCTKTETENAERYRMLDGPIFDARDQAQLCQVVFEHAGQEYVGHPESDYVKVTKDNWALLSFALRQQLEMVTAMADGYMPPPDKGEA